MYIQRKSPTKQGRVGDPMQITRNASQRVRRHQNCEQPVAESMKASARSNSKQQVNTPSKTMMSSQPAQVLCLARRRAQMSRRKPLIITSFLPGHTSFLGLILQLMVMLLIFAALIDNHAVCAMSKRFLKGFIMGAMFAHHHKP